MKKSTFSPAQIAGILKEFDNGKSAEAITREHGVSKASLISGDNAMEVWKHPSLKR